MSGPAKVHSTDAIEAVRLALVSFIDRVSNALSELSSEMRRVQEWLEHDRPGYWKHQTRLATDQVHEAQQALHRCLMFPIADEPKLSGRAGGAQKGASPLGVLPAEE